MTKRLTEPLMNLSDEELLSKMLAGEEEAFELLFDRREATVYQFALRMSGSPALADDVVQDVFLALLRRGQLFDPARGTVAKYLLGMTRNRVLTLLEREQSYLPLLEEDGQAETLLARHAGERRDPLRELARNERVEAVRQAVLALPLHYREVVVLCNLEELSYEQAANVIGCPVGTVRSRLNRARALLEDKLSRHQQPAAEPPRLAVVAL